MTDRTDQFTASLPPDLTNKTVHGLFKRHEQEKKRMAEERMAAKFWKLESK